VQPTRYKIVVEGELGPRYAAAFHPMQVDSRDGATTIVGSVQDQADLHGILDTIKALGLSLVSVAPLHP
jgi:hypothetical protein